ncbi:hypothetical protein SKAU_G00307300 [Synaphobranchus kaupii]|uniref:Uncharacterized protein n=1 Tax=Synaphobranchus kaupii TaxID=118154 RepID=A0A9Q1ER08_SYNKA|nr:hypothetical protein SKAU_G00307300 [Synaphobranchus kaupii]
MGVSSQTSVTTARRSHGNPPAVARQAPSAGTTQYGREKANQTSSVSAVTGGRRKCARCPTRDEWIQIAVTHRGFQARRSLGWTRAGPEFWLAGTKHFARATDPCACLCLAAAGAPAARRSEGGSHVGSRPVAGAVAPQPLAGLVYRPVPHLAPTSVPLTYCTRFLPPVPFPLFRPGFPSGKRTTSDTRPSV